MRSYSRSSARTSRRRECTVSPCATRFADLCAVLAILLLPGAAVAQAPGGIQGRVVAADTGEGLQSAAVFVTGLGRTTLTGPSGGFSFSGLPAGEYTLTVERLGFASAERNVSVPAGSVARVVVEIAERAIQVDEVIVTATREAQSLSQTAASVGVVGRAELESAMPSHPSDIMNGVPGVWVNMTSGEGHMTAIRQPLSTEAVYLYLENGVPTRSTGFFNHNALYEVNVPQAQRIEVMKGPSNALYGSDAIGGVINVTTQAPTEDPSVEATLEGGPYGYARILASGSGTWGGNGLRTDVNFTRTDGWRDGTAYDRISGTLQWNRISDGGFAARTMLTYSGIDQNTAGSSALSRADYIANPTLNYTPISFRDVTALRLSSELEIRGRDWSATVTPYFRHNSMDMLPNWSLTYDPTVYETGNESYGMLAKARMDFPDAGFTLIGGLDVDYSPGARTEWRTDPTRGGADDAIFVEYTREELLYDYAVTFHQVSPYVHTALDATDRIHLTAGLRADFMGYDYDNHLGVLTTGDHHRPPDASPTFEAVSPKFGVTFEAAESLDIFAAVRKGFRAPSEGDLFRQGSAENTLGLEPIKSWSYEIGGRGLIGGRIAYDVAIYRMTKKDDILGFEQPDGDSETVNAGETLHRGIEIGLGFAPTSDLRLNAAVSFQEHTYQEWQPAPGVEYSGNEIQFGPNVIGNAEVTYEPPWLSGADFVLEWRHLGPYYMDQTNEHTYEGHDLLNLRLGYQATDQVRFFARIDNLTDERYAERATYNPFRGEELAPGLPRTLHAGVSIR